MLRNIIEIDEALCTGCGMCILDCAEGALKLEGGKAKVIGEHLCDGLGHCLQCCPTGALKIIQREADAYDPEAVRVLQEQRKAQEPAASAGGCLQASLPEFSAMQEIPARFISGAGQGASSKWPVKLALLKDLPQGAKLLLCADCAPVVVDGFRKQFYENYHVATLCPKFQNTGELAVRLREILRHSKPDSITCMRMSVPCCQGLSLLGKGVADACGDTLDVKEIIIDLDGTIADSR